MRRAAPPGARAPAPAGSSSSYRAESASRVTRGEAVKGQALGAGCSGSGHYMKKQLPEVNPPALLLPAFPEPLACAVRR